MERKTENQDRYMESVGEEGEKDVLDRTKLKRGIHNVRDGRSGYRRDERLYTVYHGIYSHRQKTTLSQQTDALSRSHDNRVFSAHIVTTHAVAVIHRGSTTSIFLASIHIQFRHHIPGFYSL